MTNNSTATATAKFIQESVAAAASAAAASELEGDMSLWQALRNLAAWFSYITSKWAIATFALVCLPIA
jgi:adenylosuccinate lyase